MLILLIIFVLICVAINFSLRARGWREARSDHFDGRKFHNFSPEFWNRPVDKKAAVEVLEFDLGFDFFTKMLVSHWRKRPLPDGLAYPVARILGKEIVVTFVNHSTVLIQTEGVNILTDPVWARRASPFPFLGPKRYMPPGVMLADLPKIDLVLLSHNHYDHLDVKTLRKISERDRPHIFTTLGNSEYLLARGIPGGNDLDWGESRKFSDMISVECVPAQHFSGRAISDRNKTLWGGFVISASHGDIYFAGDTGYGPFIAHIRKKYPNGFRLAFLPIGAFRPARMMRKMHMGPDDAVRLYKDLKVARAVSTHLGTFQLALDRQDEAPNLLRKLLAEPKNSDVRFDILQNGQSVKIK